ncbi:hypothetical protein BV22DRAFT_1034684 [Leucogyrophana mollusca]|uniref:Uncharacterized protein n=1 Tax=Leucogyrophana mollusca TaxID=85980 RepID=A0ACB8BK04_9AGAM|nr:hypothetical protein BV22DRAFT_1034684 [Leucogyrophana mollusca]
MSDKKEPGKRQSKASAAKVADKVPASSSASASQAGRKRKADAQGDKHLALTEPQMHGPSPRREERRSDILPVPPHVLDQQRGRHSHPHSHSLHASDSTHRRVSMDLHSLRRPSIPAIAPRPPRSRRASMPGPQRTMLQHAWHTALTTDPLADSDEENPDGHVRADYVRRMHVISRLRGRPPTPGSEDPSHSLPMDSRVPVLDARRRPLFA